MFGDLAEARRFAVGQAVIAQLQRADQRAMHDQVRIAPDGRGVMRVFRQIQSEMAQVVRGIDRLRLGAQHDVVHHLLVRAVLGVCQDAVEDGGLHHLALGEIHADGAQVIGKGEQLFLGRFLVHAIDQRHARLFQRLRRRHIGQHHEFLDQAHGFQAFSKRDGGNLAVGADLDAPLGQIEVERIARLARFDQCPIRRPQRF